MTPTPDFTATAWKLPFVAPLSKRFPAFTKDVVDDVAAALTAAHDAGVRAERERVTRHLGDLESGASLQTVIRLIRAGAPR